MKNAAAVDRHGATGTAVPILLLINNICAAVLGVVGFGVARGTWAFLTETDGLDLAGVDTQQAHHARNGFRTTLAQCQVVLGSAAGVSVPFDTYALLRI